LGIPEYEAKQYEAKVKEGNILISVHTRGSDDIKRIKEIMKDTQAEDISVTGEEKLSDANRLPGSGQTL
jgi:hypothetical protein